MKRYAILLIIPLLLFLSGCRETTAKILYRTLEWRINSEIDNYFGLNNQEEAELKKTVDRHLNWYRVHGLEDMITLLRMARTHLQEGITRKDFSKVIAFMERHRDRVQARILPDVVDFLRGLREEQIAHLRKALEKDEKEYIEEMERTREEKIKEWSKSFMRGLKFVLGEVTEEQKKILMDTYRQMPDTGQEYLAHRRYMNRRFIELLEERNSLEEEAFRKRLLGLVESYEKDRSPGYRAKEREARKLALRGMMRFDETLTDAQRKHGVERIDMIMEMVRALKDGE
jgi:predicted HicB family RNase H-like nuclease